MNHLSFEMLNMYLDNELDEPTRASVEAHLATCSACQRELAELQAIFAELIALPAAPLPIDLAPVVVEQIKPAPRRAIPLWGLLAAQVVFIVMLAMWLVPMLTSWTSTVSMSLPTVQTVPSVEALERWLNSPELPPVLIERLHTLETTIPGPLAAITPEQWAISIAVAVVLWLVGSWLSLTGLPRDSKRSQEAV